MDRQQVYSYIRRTFVHEDRHLQRIRRATREHGLPGVHITAEEGHMLAFLLRLIGARRVVEIGTLAGYSATWIARALPPDGTLITCEANPDHTALARDLFEEGGLSDRVRVLEGDAKVHLKAIEPPVDAIFIDADKDHMRDYLDWAAVNVRPGGLILAHNALMRGRILDESADRRVAAMQDFTQHIAAHADLHSTIVPIGDGFIAAQVAADA